MPEALLNPLHEGDRNLKRLLRVLGVPVNRCLAASSAATFFGPPQTRGSCLPLALLHPRGIAAPQWHQVLWVTGAWICCGCLQRPPAPSVPPFFCFQRVGNGALLSRG